MKQIIKFIITGISLATITCGPVSAQSSDRSLAYRNIEPKQMLEYAAIDSGDHETARSDKEMLKDAKSTLKGSKAAIKEIKANVRCSENFKRTFKNGPEPVWTVMDNAIDASFTKDGIKTRVDYTKKGYWIHTLTYFPGEKTPADVAKIVGFDYPASTIRLAVKVLEGTQEFYIVELEDKLAYREVAVVGDVTDLVRELRKN